MKPTNVYTSLPRLNECKLLIQSHPLFSDLSSDLALELAGLCKLQLFQTGDVIVKENDWVDAVYFIAEGQAEVKRHFAQMEMVPIAILQKHETIGLSETGFYSITGRRFATITALSKMITFQLTIDKLNFFLMSHPEMHQKIKDTSRVLSVTYFIQQALPFLPTSFDTLYMIARQIRETVVPSHTYVFHQHQVADACYLLISGKAEVLAENEHGNMSHIATLSPPTIFGEAALLTNAPRNASILTLEPCHLLMLNAESLEELVATEPHAHTALKQLIELRAQSRRVENPPITPKNDTKNIGGKYFHLTKEGWLICQ